MTSLVFLIEQIAPALYIFIAVGVFLAWLSWRRARYAYRATTFELERDVARYRIGGALTLMALSVEAGLIVLGIQREVAPTVREDRELREIIEAFERAPNDGLFVTPTRSGPVGTLPVDASGRDLNLGPGEATRMPFPTLTLTPVGTLVRNAPAAAGCDKPNALLQIPANGMRVFQTIPVIGAAYHDDFLAYKLELSGPGTGNQFVILDERTTPVGVLSTLSQFDPAAYAPGEYRFRLTVFDTTTTLQAHCEVTIYVTATD